MNEKVDIYSYFWNDRFGIDFNHLKQKIDKEEISWRAKLIKLNNKKERAKKTYISWFKNKKEEKIPCILLSKKYDLLNKILKDNENNTPQYSCLIEITFKLKKPYLSKDDDNFYIIDNPIVKDKVFKLPMVRATTWKGALRFAALKVFEEEFNVSNWKEKRTLLVRLFGNEKDATEKYLNEIVAEKIRRDKNKANEIGNEFKEYLLEKGYISKEIASKTGRLFFYPTFFNNVSLDVITPLSRETKTPVRGPIYFEIVPENTKGVFKLLYYPFDLIARGEFDKIEKEAEEDFEFLSKTLQKMFCEIGFSAKKTSGFGVAEVEEIKIKPGDKMHKTVEKTKDIFETVPEFKGKMKIEEDGKHG